ncbi:MAG: hypothetical protein JW891_07115 [Candidatus Lokiarchaeota archaeon]|nr:hypothetical protein [Candidatus Lokiarchaeota archaeon]
MGTDGPGIMQGSFQMDLESKLTEFWDLDLGTFLDNKLDPKKSPLKKEIFEKNLSKVLGYIDALNGTLIVLTQKRIAYQVLGYFVLLTGAEISEDLNEKILIASDFQREKHKWPEFWREEREFCLNELRESIINHKPGKIVHLTT